MHSYFKKSLFIFLGFLFLSLSFSNIGISQEDWQNELLLGQEASGKGDIKAAIKHYKKAIELNPDPVFEGETLAAMGMLYVPEKNYKKAAKYLDQSIKKLEKLDQPSTLLPQIYAMRAVVAIGLGDGGGFLGYTTKAKAARELIAGQTEKTGTVWKTNTQSNSITHVQTGIEFPFQMGTFLRSKNVTFKPDGSDVSLIYFIGEGGSEAVFSIYFTANQDPSLLGVVNATKQVVTGRYGGVLDPISENYVGNIAGGEGVSGGGYRGIFETNAEAGGPGKINTEIWLVKHGNWNIKFRLTYKPSARKEVEQNLGQAIDAIQLPEKSSFVTLFAQQSLGIEVCKAPIADISGESKPVVADNFIRMGVALEASAKAIPQEGDPPGKCLAGVQAGSNGYKLATYIPDFEKKEAVFLEPAIYEMELFDNQWKVTNRFAVYRSAMLEQALEQQESDLKGPFYYLGQHHEKGFQVYNVFQGKPSLGTAIIAVSEVLSGNHPAIVAAQVDEEGNLKTSIVPAEEVVEEEAGGS